MAAQEILDACDDIGAVTGGGGGGGGTGEPNLANPALGQCSVEQLITDQQKVKIVYLIFFNS